ncbi:MAG TPA: RpiB/LacA/LacB family sugar-phosphate isomerase [Tepidisphaeraceae bacterium]|jgi:ribose 5-phosphate isomerase RpiB|nr:RpiB/LacA/LacB family sugar-phosphate isomerase [Tepidisphaeraceae bacterium]
MIFSARQLQELHKTNGHVTLPYRARLTPLAQDWVRAQKIAVEYSDMEKPIGAPLASAASPAPGSPAKPQAAAGTFLYWCDGPCGPAKAAIVTQAKESSLIAIETSADPRHLVEVIKHLAAEVKENRVVGGILVVTSGALAMLFANRCPSVRAVLGSCQEAVEQGVGQMGANVLVIEHKYKTLPQVKNMLSRFVRGTRSVSDDVQRQLKELASCG